MEFFFKKKKESEAGREKSSQSTQSLWLRLCSFSLQSHTLIHIQTHTHHTRMREWTEIEAAGWLCRLQSRRDFLLYFNSGEDLCVEGGGVEGAKAGKRRLVIRF